MRSDTLVYLLFFTAFICSFPVRGQEKGKRPNIILMVSDDHAYQAISAYGHGLNETPNIDKLADQGAIFTRATVTNSICAPSRAVILTGKHSFINGKVDNVQPFNWDQESFPKELQKAGYATAMIGKIHLDGLPQGFDFSMVLPGQGHYYNPDFMVNGERKRIEGYVTDITTEYALKWLKEDRDKEKPFLLIYNQKAPHRNWKPAPEYLNLYDEMSFTPPDNFFDAETGYEGRGTAAKTQEMEIAGHAMWGHDFKFLIGPEGNKTGLDNQLKRFNKEQRSRWEAAYGPKNKAFIEKYFPGEKTFKDIKTSKKVFKDAETRDREIALWKYNRYIKDYLRTIKSVDDGVGELLNYLEENDLADNTIVIYTSDQGFYLGEHGWFDKRFMYEQSFRTPLLMRYPKEIKPGTVIDELVQNLDFAPTLLDYAKVQAPSAMQGESFRDLVSGKSKKWRDAVYYTYYEYPSVHMVKRHYGVSTKRYKLIHFYYDIDEWEMYDLKEDPDEMNNIYDDPEYAEVRADLHQKLKELREQYGDSDELQQEYLNTYLEHQSIRKEK
ncbi:sulfatase family protein [Sinomicrobium weinanense]|uniref:Sulfatase n=1 Tax=Sinomicrobium weinanense TaxID=2842200 RepID=A0A926JVB1_9FLAO|nr:sulfatase [Sinomicrobium weinanense]MBC9798227.1 sulfatase [Sinomicrobium weinanense]MBU3125319.1 sulfatase [Sinomicrobium weinanense]